MSNRLRKKKRVESVALTLQNFTRALLDFLISFYILLILAILPFYASQGYSYIATDKAMFFRQASLNMGKLVAVVLLVQMAVSLVSFLSAGRNAFGGAALQRLWQGVRASVTPTDCFMGLYGLAVVISYLCSRYRNVALWGAEGWYMGLFTQLALVCAYFLISRFWEPRTMLFCLLYPISGIVFALGYLNRFGWYPIQMALSSPGYISTIGNINWYCGYAVTAFFAGLGFFWKGGAGEGWQEALISLYVGLGFATLITQGSDSGLVALGVMLLVLFVLSVREAVRMLRFWYIMLLFSAACLFTMLLRLAVPGQITLQDGGMDLLTTGPLPMLLAVTSFGMLVWLDRRVKRGSYPERFLRMLSGGLAGLAVCGVIGLGVLIAVNTIGSGNIGGAAFGELFAFSDTWGSNRGATWKAGILCFWEQDVLHKLLGVGPDAMVSYLYRDGSQKLQELVGRVFGGTMLTNAHNEWLTVLVNTGILGLLGFGGAVIASIKALIGGKGQQPVACACGLALLAYTINNIFSFQQSMNMTTVCILLGMGMAFLRNNGTENEK